MSGWEKVYVCDECSHAVKYSTYVCPNCGDIKSRSMWGVPIEWTVKAGRKVSDKKWYSPRTWDTFHYEIKE